jgi:uncharacterized RDD family membrane protein YckC
LRVAVAILAAPDRILLVPFRGTVRSAKRTVIQTCKQCGAINQSSVELCCFCSARLNPSAGPEEKSASNGSTIPAPPKFSVAAAGASRTSGSLALQPEWRREVNQRLRSYRERHGHSGNGDSQTALEFAHADDESLSGATATLSTDDHPAENDFANTAQVQPQIHFDSQVHHEFDEATDAAVTLDEDQYEDPLQATLAAAAARVESEALAPTIPVKKQEPFQHLLIDVSRPPDVEIAGPARRDAAEESAQIFPRHDSTLLPVADLSLRRRAAAVDAVCILSAFAVVLGGFAFFGGRLIASKLDAFVCGAILTLLYTQYFSLFTMMGGATPGMMLVGLRLVSFDGAAPEPRQLIRRSAAYLLSGGMAFMGFLWSFWDEDHLSWHDHISQTYITPIASTEVMSITGSTRHQSQP